MGHVQIFRDFPSPQEGYGRTVRVYTPDAYDREPQRRFPVLYMQDGQNVFAHPESARFETWCANTALERLVAAGRIEPWMVVAVDHGLDRFTEYSPWDEPRLGHRGRAAEYVSFLADTLKPWVDRTYRTRPETEHTGVMGSSLGGLVSLYAGLSRPEVFGRVGGVSPTVMWASGRLFDAWTAHPGRWTRVYLDVGGEEWLTQEKVPLDYPPAVVRFYEHLKSLGYADWELRLVYEEGAWHDELAWQRRLPEIFRWLLS